MAFSVHLFSGVTQLFVSFIYSSSGLVFQVFLLSSRVSCGLGMLKRSSCNALKNLSSTYHVIFD